MQNIDFSTLELVPMTDNVIEAKTTKPMNHLNESLAPVKNVNDVHETQMAMADEILESWSNE